MNKCGICERESVAACYISYGHKPMICNACATSGAIWAAQMAYLEANLPAPVEEGKPAGKVTRHCVGEEPAEEKKPVTRIFCGRCDDKGYYIRGTMAYACNCRPRGEQNPAEEVGPPAPLDPSKLEPGCYLIHWKPHAQRKLCLSVVGRSDADGPTWLCSLHGYGGCWADVERVEPILLQKDVDEGRYWREQS